MEDSISVISSESATNSDEFVFVNKGTGISSTESTPSEQPKAVEQPQLGIANNGNMSDLCLELKEVLNDVDCEKSPTKMDVLEVGRSKFYKTSDDSQELDVQQECTIFNGVCYLGAATIDAPKSESLIQKNIAILNEQSSEQAIRVSLSIPSSSDGIVVLYDAATQQVIARYEIHRIVIYVRGNAGTSESSCFAFTLAHGDSKDTVIYQCHVCRCDIPEAVGQVSQCFAKAFKHPQSLASSEISSVQEFVFEVSLEIKEEDGKGGYTTVPRERSCFKLRVNQEKELCLAVQLVSSNDRQLDIERCFGVLVAPGRNVKQSDMRLLEMVSMGTGIGDKQICFISGRWDPTEPEFKALNTETPKESKIYVSVAVDFVIRGIRDPVRFLIELPAKIYPNNTRFWYLSSRKLVQQYSLRLTEISPETFEVVSIETTGELDKSRLNLPLNLASRLSLISRSPVITSLDAVSPNGDESDNDEPMLSGTGFVSKDCSVTELEVWAEALAKWGKGEMRPKDLGSLVRAGIPEALRGEVWQRLAGCEDDQSTLDTFRVLITKDCPCENVIQRDINRTFPAHDFFKEAGGLGQDSLYRVTKAYALHDKEVGYCQGLSFVAATLLLHMPEEQAFCVLVRMMYQYGLRELYKDGFENLYLRLYQLNRLLDDQLPQLRQHLADNNVESHMFASQWFLTVFTARFPLYLVYHILDVFLLQGIDTLFQVALSLLMLCKKDLLQLDFENILKYFRVSLPKKCRNKEVAQAIMKQACSLKVKKLKNYEREFMDLKEAQDNAETFTDELETVKTNLERTEEEKTRLEAELTQVKAMLKREVDRAEADARRSNDIIAEYKKINARLDDEQAAVKNRLLELRNEVTKCETCRERVKDLEITSEQRNIERITETNEPQLPRALERIRELELELAQTKLERVQAECWKQELTHQLNSTLAELQTAKTSWIHKTFSTIKDAAVNKKDGDGVVANDESGELVKRAFVTRRTISREKDERSGIESPRRSQTMETMSTIKRSE